MPLRGLVKGMWGRKAAVATGVIAVALLVVVQASAGSAAGAPHIKVPERNPGVKGVGASLQEIVRETRVSGISAAADLARTRGSTSPRPECA